MVFLLRNRPKWEMSLFWKTQILEPSATFHSIDADVCKRDLNISEKHIGKTHRPGEWYGIELLQPVGTNNGVMEGKRYLGIYCLTVNYHFDVFSARETIFLPVLTLSLATLDVFCGVLKLRDPAANNHKSRDFRCKAKHGCFVMRDCIRQVLQGPQCYKIEKKSTFPLQENLTTEYLKLDSTRNSKQQDVR